MFKLIYGGLFRIDSGDAGGNEIEEQIEMSGLLRYIIAQQILKSCLKMHDFKVSLCSFSSLTLQFQHRFYDALTSNRVDGTPATDTAPPAGLV